MNLNIFVTSVLLLTVQAFAGPTASRASNNGNNRFGYGYDGGSDDDDGYGYGGYDDGNDGDNDGYYGGYDGYDGYDPYDGYDGNGQPSSQAPPHGNNSNPGNGNGNDWWDWPPFGGNDGNGNGNGNGNGGTGGSGYGYDGYYDGSNGTGYGYGYGYGYDDGNDGNGTGYGYYGGSNGTGYGYGYGYGYDDGNDGNGTGYGYYGGYEDSTTASTAQTGPTFTAGPGATPSTSPPSQQRSCGQRFLASRPRIVGGSNAAKNQYPWIVRLQTSSGYLCGATVISDSYLLTAAHCIAERPSHVDAYFGDHNQNARDSGEYSMRVTQYTIHPRYDETNYDMALMRLPRRLTFSNEVQPACLPVACPQGQARSQCREGSDAYIAGWGALESDGPTPPILQHAKVKVASRSVCGRQYGEITHQMMCAGYIQGGVDSCQGDSGGPLFGVENGAYTLCGVTSFGEGCALPNYFGVYANVCSEIQWIKTNAGIPGAYRSDLDEFF